MKSSRVSILCWLFLVPILIAPKAFAGLGSKHKWKTVRDQFTVEKVEPVIYHCEFEMENTWPVPGSNGVMRTGKSAKTDFCELSLKQKSGETYRVIAHPKFCSLKVQSKAQIEIRSTFCDFQSANECYGDGTPMHNAHKDIISMACIEGIRWIADGKAGKAKAKQKVINPPVAPIIGEQKVEIGDFEVLEIKMLQYLCEDQNFKPTGKFVESPICQIKLKLGEKTYEAAAEKEFCSVPVGSKKKLVLRKFDCHTRFANVCDESGKPTTSSHTDVGSMACEEGLQWVLRHDHQHRLDNKQKKKSGS